MMGNRTNEQWVAQYATSHTHPVNRFCHTVGIPMIAISLLVIVRHHSNIRKLLHGTEDKFTHKRPIDALATED